MTALMMKHQYFFLLMPPCFPACHYPLPPPPSAHGSALASAAIALHQPAISPSCLSPPPPRPVPRTYRHHRRARRYRRLPPQDPALAPSHLLPPSSPPLCPACSAASHECAHTNFVRAAVLLLTRQLPRLSCPAGSIADERQDAGCILHLTADGCPIVKRRYACTCWMHPKHPRSESLCACF